MKINIISRVDVAYTEADLIRLVTAEIQAVNPEVEVHSVTFDRKLNPTRIAVNIDAGLIGAEPVTTPVEETTGDDTEEAPVTVTDIFGEDE